MATETPFLCSICFKSVSLEDCKIDEDGRPIHETCYATSVLYKHPSTGNPAGKSPGPGAALGWRGIGWKIMRIVRRR